jgi:hypothetical protein
MRHAHVCTRTARPLLQRPRVQRCHHLRHHFLIHHCVSCVLNCARLTLNPPHATHPRSSRSQPSGPGRKARKQAPPKPMPEDVKPRNPRRLYVWTHSSCGPSLHSTVISLSFPARAMTLCLVVLARNLPRLCAVSSNLFVRISLCCTPLTFFTPVLPNSPHVPCHALPHRSISQLGA